jgi:hypothetical protein
MEVCGRETRRQGLKPAFLEMLNGTAKAVPYPKPIYVGVGTKPIHLGVGNG